jgi:hypothetical protein
MSSSEDRVRLFVLAVVTGLGLFAREVFPTPFGLETIFGRLLGPVGILSGYGIATIAEKQLTQLPLAKQFGLLPIGVVVCAGSAIFYLFLHESISTPGVLIGGCPSFC